MSNEEKDPRDGIVTEFPRLFRVDDEGYNGVRRWGLQCGTGWNALIRKLCQDIEAVATEAGLSAEEWPRVLQVKEKFGRLRFYYTTTADLEDPKFLAIFQRISALVDEAGKRSGEICEQCGAPGTTRDAIWIHTACDICEKRYKNG